jgi:putative DNA primase/helicase
VSASETSGARFNEARIKKMTGRDPITCRALYQGEFTYLPELTLWLSVNHLPKVKDDSVGFWSRPHRVPFLQCFTGREDKTLKTRLREDEGPGILAWIIRGCIEWQKSGLNPPRSVLAAVEEYRLSQEPLAGFYEDRCVIKAGAKAPLDELFGVYGSWCDERRMFIRLGPKSFRQELAKRFGDPQRSMCGGVRARVFHGIGVAANDAQSEI